MGKVLKKYSSGCVLSMTVTLKDGGTRYVDFDDSTHGSVLYTDDEKLQWGLEHSSLFGKSYKLVSAEEIEPTEQDTDNEEPDEAQLSESENGTETKDEDAEAQDEAQLSAAENDTETNDEDAEAQDDDESSEMRVVTVSGSDDAVEYLVENFNVSRRGLKKNSSIIEVAREHGVVFDGLN